MSNLVKVQELRIAEKAVVGGAGGRQRESHPPVVEVTFEETDEPDKVSKRSDT